MTKVFGAGAALLVASMALVFILGGQAGDVLFAVTWGTASVLAGWLAWCLWQARWHWSWRGLAALVAGVLVTLAGVFTLASVPTVFGVAVAGLGIVLLYLADRAFVRDTLNDAAQPI
jgi:hypothetical protein